MVVESCAHVLELGCAGGIMLSTLAERFPNTTFVGVDILQQAIDNANRIVQGKGLKNISFIQADVSAVEIT